EVRQPEGRHHPAFPATSDSGSASRARSSATAVTAKLRILQAQLAALLPGVQLQAQLMTELQAAVAYSPGGNRVTIPGATPVEQLANLVAARSREGGAGRSVLPKPTPSAIGQRHGMQTELHGEARP